LLCDDQPASRGLHQRLKLVYGIQCAPRSVPVIAAATIIASVHRVISIVSVQAFRVKNQQKITPIESDVFALGSFLFVSLIDG
jgi:hypothetical protein